MAYKDLSIRERAAVIKTAVSNGIHTLPEIKEAYNKFDEGGQKSTIEEVAPAINTIVKNRNKLDRKYDFIVDTWDSEFNGAPKGYDAKKDLYFTYPSPEKDADDKGTIGPGLKVRTDGKGDAYSFTESEVKNGVTRQQINEKLGNNADLQYTKALEFLNQKGNRLPYDTISPNIMRGLMDLRYQRGALGEFNKLREAVLKGDIKGIQKESKVTYVNQQGKRVPDTRRNNLRKNRFWHFDDGGKLHSTGGPIYPFSFSKRGTPQVRY